MSVVNLDDRRPKKTYSLTLHKEGNTLSFVIDGTDMSSPPMLEVARDLANAAEAIYDFHRDD